MRLIFRRFNKYRFVIHDTYQLYGYLEKFSLKIYYTNNSGIGYETWCDNKKFYI
jgi:hypothetical protein